MPELYYNRWKEPPTPDTKRKLNIAIKYVESLIAPHRFNHRFEDTPRFGELEQYRTRYDGFPDETNDIPDRFILKCTVLTDEGAVGGKEMAGNIREISHQTFLWLNTEGLSMDIGVGFSRGLRPVDVRKADYEAAIWIDENFSGPDGEKMLEPE